MPLATRTTSLVVGTRAGDQVDALLQLPERALWIVEVAQKSGM
jgi:hypothetical protein